MQSSSSNVRYRYSYGWSLSSARARSELENINDVTVCARELSQNTSFGTGFFSSFLIIIPHIILNARKEVLVVDIAHIGFVYATRDAHRRYESIHTYEELVWLHIIASAEDMGNESKACVAHSISCRMQTKTSQDGGTIENRFSLSFLFSLKPTLNWKYERCTVLFFACLVDDGGRLESLQMQTTQNFSA